MRIISISLINLQSWSGHNILELCPEVESINVLRAPSETGKSTLSRFFIKFCQGGSDYSDYIRDGEESGAVRITYEDKSSTVFLMERYSRYIAVFNSEDEIVSSYCDKDINEQVLQSVGLVYDSKNDLPLNIFSRDLPTLFVNTSDTANGAILYRVLIDRNVERILDNLKNYIDRLTEVLKFNKFKGKMAIESCKGLKPIDIDLVRATLQEVKALKQLSKLLSLVFEKEKDYTLSQNKLSTAKQYAVSSKDIENLCLVNSLISDVRKAYTQYKTNKVQLDGYESVPFGNQFLENLVAVVKGIKEIKGKMRTIESLREKLSNSVAEEAKAVEALAKFKEDIGICPLCGGKL